MIDSITAWLKGIHPMAYGMAIGALAGFWSQAKGMLIRFTAIFFDRWEFSLQDNQFIYFMIKVKGFKFSFIDPTRVNERHSYCNYVKGYTDNIIYYTMPENGSKFLFKYGFPLMFISNTKGGKGGRNEPESPGEHGCSITTLRYLINIRKLMREYQFWNLNKKTEKTSYYEIFHRSGNRFRSKTKEEATQDETSSGKRLKGSIRDQLPVFFSEEDLREPDTKSKDYLYKQDSLLSLFKDLDFFIESKEWFNDRKITYKRGYLFYGVPGTGKSSIVRAIAEYYQIPLNVFDLGSCTNDDFRRQWARAENDSSVSIRLIEDIDAVYHGRENITNNDADSSGVTFDCFLNTIDGVQKNNGSILILTTNDITKIDAALYHETTDGQLSRPGRIDKVVEFGLIDDEGKRFIAKRILKGYEDKIEQIIAEDKSITPAQFENVCINYAIKYFNAEAEKVVAS
jgi:SpoVK/Ycf46/Vps4 family AAA+-type ATPase